MLILLRALRSMRLDREEGQVIPMFAAGALAMLVMTGVVVDGGNLFQSRQTVQNAADAAALAAAYSVANDSTNGCSASLTAATSAPCQTDAATAAGAYAGYNGVSGTNGDITTSISQPASRLPACSSLSQTPAVSATQPPNAGNAPGCYVYPYNNNSALVEVWLTRNTSNFFGGVLGIKKSTESARSVAGLGPAPPPKVNFASLFDGCKNHTLLIKAGGTLTVNQTIYTDSCNVPQDAFDIFGGGSITAPEIDVVGGWETHDNSTVFTSTGTPPKKWPAVYQCSLANSQSLYHAGPPVTWTTPPNGCPIDGSTKLVDPFAALPTPTVPNTATGASASVTHKGRQSGVATLVTAPTLPAYPGAQVAVSNVDDPSFDTGGATVTSSNGNLLSYANAGADVPAAAVAQANVSSGNIRNYVVTLHLASAVSLCVGDAITVQNVDASANGTFSVLAVNGLPIGCNSSTTTITYQSTNAAASTTYEKGGPAGTPSFSTETLTGCDQNSTCTATIGGLSVAASVHAGDEIDVNNATDEPTFDGSYSVKTDSTGTSVSYQPSPFVMTFQTDAIAAGKVTLNILGPDDPPASLQTAPAATMIVSTTAPDGSPGDARFDCPNANRCTVLTSNPGTDVVTYNAPSLATTGYSTVKGTSQATVNTSVVTELQPGDVIKVTITGAQACMTGNHTVVSSDSSSVTYAVANTCPSASSGTASGTIVTQQAAGDDVDGTAQVVTNSATPANGSTVVIPIDKTFSIGGTAKVSVLTVLATSGTASIVNTGTALAPKPYEVPFGTATLNPGTYYGGICIGAATGKDCTGTNCNNTVNSSANVTLSPGIYYIAGGGFHVCGGSILNAPHVLIYNTNDAGNTGTTYGKLGQIQIDTTGLVTLGPQNSGVYSGLTIFQDRSLVLTHAGPTTSNDTCDAKSGKPAEWDIAFESMGDPGAPDHALGGISGTIYAPGEASVNGTVNDGADFGLQVSGTTTLAVFTSCIFINGVNDVFNYSSDSSQLLGLGVTLEG